MTRSEALEDIQFASEMLAENLPSWRKRMLVAMLIALGVSVITGVLFGVSVTAIYQSYDAWRRFESAEGTVHIAQVHTSSDSDGDTSFKPFIEYSYTVGGVSHTSASYSLGEYSSSNRNRADEIVAANQPGTKVTVWYDPKAPDNAVLNTKTPSMYYFLMLFIQPFVLMAIGAIVYAVTVPSRFNRDKEFLAAPMRQPWTVPGWGTMLPGRQGLVLEQNRRPFFAFAIGFGITCFASTFIVLFYYGLVLGVIEKMEPTAILIVMTIAIAIGMISSIRSLRRRQTRFEIDQAASSLRLESSKRKFTVNFAEIDYWLLKMVLRGNSDLSTSDGDDTKFAPLLALMTNDGVERPIHLFGTSQSQRLIAEKVAMELANLTEKAFAGITAQDTPEISVGDMSGALAAMKAMNKAAKKYIDLT